MAITLEPAGLGHVEEVQRYASDPVMGETVNFPSPYPPDGAAQWARRTVERRAAGREYVFAVLEGGSLVGVCGLVDVADGSAELGYWVGRPFWGRGYATEAARMVLRFGFEELGLAKVTARCLERNPASYRVLEKAGMRFEGWRPCAHPKWGASERDACFAIKKDEWR